MTKVMGSGRLSRSREGLDDNSFSEGLCNKSWRQGSHRRSKAGWLDNLCRYQLHSWLGYQGGDVAHCAELCCSRKTGCTMWECMNLHPKCKSPLLHENLAGFRMAKLANEANPPL